MSPLWQDFQPPEPLFEPVAFWPRVTAQSWREVERVVSPTFLAPQPLRLQGALIEASLAKREPPILSRMRELGIGYLVDSQSLRFASPAYAGVASLAGLPYAPVEPIEPGCVASIPEFVRGALAFQEAAQATAYLVPGVPLRDDDHDGWRRLNAEILDAAIRLNGSRVERKPLVALVAPGQRALADIASLVNPLRDLPVEAAYVLPLNLQPTRDSIEKLVRYVRLLQSLQQAGLRVVAGRIGAFGLVLQALGVPIFDSGLGDAESHSLASLEHQARQQAAARRDENAKKTGGGKTLVYLEPIKTTVVDSVAEAVVQDRSVRSRFVCGLPCCRESGFAGLVTHRREHFLRTRHREVAALAADWEASPSLAVERVHGQLRSAHELALQVGRIVATRVDGRAPDFAHLERWVNVLARVQESPALTS